MLFSPLSPLLYFRRNLGKTLPMVFVIVISVTLVASVISIVHSINLTVYTLYGYNRYVTGLTPRNVLSVADEQVARIRKLPELGVLAPTHSYTVLVKTTFGKMPFPIFGMEPAARQLMLARTHLHLVAGRMPREGEPEAVISDDVARNLDIKLGGVLAQPDSQDAYAPVPIHLVGLLHGRVWLGLTSKSMVDAYSPFTYAGYLAFARDGSLAQQRRLDADMDRAIDHGQARVWRFTGLVKETQSALSNLYLILDIVVGIIVFAIAFVCGLLSNIYFTQRLPEIATLSAIGYSRGLLVRRACSETALLCVMGWLLGIAATIGLLQAVQRYALAPRGLLLESVDWNAFAFTIPLPVTITLFAVVTIGLRLASLDPVSIIERRG